MDDWVKLLASLYSHGAHHVPQCFPIVLSSEHQWRSHSEWVETDTGLRLSSTAFPEECDAQRRQLVATNLAGNLYPVNGTHTAEQPPDELSCHCHLPLLCATLVQNGVSQLPEPPLQARSVTPTPIWMGDFLWWEVLTWHGCGHAMPCGKLLRRHCWPGRTRAWLSIVGSVPKTSAVPEAPAPHRTVSFQSLSRPLHM